MPPNRIQIILFKDKRVFDFLVLTTVVYNWNKKHKTYYVGHNLSVATYFSNGRSHSVSYQSSLGTSPVWVKFQRSSK